MICDTLHICTLSGTSWKFLPSRILVLRRTPLNVPCDITSYINPSVHQKTKKELVKVFVYLKGERLKVFVLSPQEYKDWDNNL